MEPTKENEIIVSAPDDPPQACEPEAGSLPAYYKDTIPNYRRRNPKHDYMSRCIYMVTMRKAPEMPAFSEIFSPDGDFRHAAVRHSSLGAVIYNEIANLHYNYPGVEIYDSVVMPDHVHFIIYIAVKEKYHLGRLVAALKARCSKSWHKSCNLPEAQRPGAVFTSGFHDRISRNFNHLATIKKYVRDNPRRLLIKRHFPAYYRQRHKILIDGKLCVMTGKPFLLLHPFIEAAIHSSRCTSEENQRQYDRCLANIALGGVTAGTFFARREKELRYKAIARGCSIILMQGNGFSDRYAPPQPYFDLCAEGRCLIIGEAAYRTSSAADIRDYNRAMNALARRLASGEALQQKA